MHTSWVSAGAPKEVIKMLEVVAFPEGNRAVHWVQLNILGLQKAFMAIHKNTDPDLHGPQVHGLGLQMPVEIGVAEPPIQVVIAAHRSQSHANLTVADLMQALRHLGAPDFSFKIVSMGD